MTLSKELLNEVKHYVSEIQLVIEVFPHNSLSTNKLAQVVYGVFKLVWRILEDLSGFK
jgi:hypothetical protein